MTKAGELTFEIDMSEKMLNEAVKAYTQKMFIKELKVVSVEEKNDCNGERDANGNNVYTVKVKYQKDVQ